MRARCDVDKTPAAGVASGCGKRFANLAVKMLDSHLVASKTDSMRTSQTLRQADAAYRPWSARWAMTWSEIVAVFQVVFCRRFQL